MFFGDLSICQKKGFQTDSSIIGLPLMHINQTVDSYRNESKESKAHNMNDHSQNIHENNSLLNESSSTTNKVNGHGILITQAFGVTLALGSGLAQAILILGEKKAVVLEPPVPGPVLAFWISVAGLPISIALVPVLEEIIFVSDIGAILLVIGHAATAGFSIILLCLALEIVPAVVVSLIMTSDLPIRVLAQYLVIPDFQPPGGGLYDILGSVVVTLALCLAGIWDLMDMWKEKQKPNNNELIPLNKNINTDEEKLGK